MSIKGLFRVLLGTVPDCLCPWDAIYCERLSARAPACVCVPLGWQSTRATGNVVDHLMLLTTINAFILSHAFSLAFPFIFFVCH